MFDHKVAEIQEANQEKMERDLLELKERSVACVSDNMVCIISEYV